MVRFFIPPLIIFLLASRVIATSNLDAVQTIASFNDYDLQRLCAQYCFWHNSGDIVAGDIGCPFNPTVNSCYCRADLQVVAVSALASCVASGCGGYEVDIESATSLYKAYCTPKIKPADAAAATTSSISAITTVHGTSPPATTVIITKTPTPTATRVLFGTSASGPANGVCNGRMNLAHVGIVGLVGIANM